MTKRYSMMILDGSRTAASNAIKDSVLDPRGGGLDTFSVALQRVGGGGAAWWGASWVMEETGPGISFETFTADIIGGLSLKHNTGAANVQIVTMSEDDFPLGTSAKAQFIGMLADLTRKKSAYERVPDEPI